MLGISSEAAEQAAIQIEIANLRTLCRQTQKQGKTPKSTTDGYDLLHLLLRPQG
jgi:hypothetical protein